MPFVPKYLFKDFYIRNNLGEWRRCLSAEQREGILTAHHKRFRFPEFRVPLLCSNSLCVQVSLSPLGIVLWGLGFRKPTKNADTLATAIAVVNNKLSLFKNNALFFIPGPEVLDLLPSGSMKLWQANLLAYKKREISDLPQFLTVIMLVTYCYIKNWPKI